MDAHTIFLWYFAIINIVSVIIFGWDKFCAKNHRWRVPEMTLLMFAVIGGSIGALFAMRIFHHKTLHLKFKYGVPLILFFQVLIMVYLHTTY